MGAMYPDFKSDNAAKLAASCRDALHGHGIVIGICGLDSEAFPIYFFL